MNKSSQFSQLLYASTIAVDLRWFYGTIAFIFGSMTMTSSPALLGKHGIFIFFAIYLVCNLLLYLLLADLPGRDRRYSSLQFINASQVILDLIYISLLLFFVGPSLMSLGYVLYFIPIILAVLFFDFYATILVALSASICLFTLKSYLLGWTSTNEVPVTGVTQISAFIEVSVVVLMYFLTVLFGGWMIRSIKTRERQLIERMHKEEEHLKELSILAREFDQSAKLLVRRDLDLMKAHRSLERLDQMKSEIISVVAHQLRTPLSAVKWTLKMLTDGDAGAVTSEQKTMMLKAYESNERMISLVNDMLSAERMESGKFRYRFFPIQLEDLIENVVTEILSKATDRGITVRFLRPAQNLPRVTIDPDKIREVLQNLIDNAIKYSRRGGTVTIGLQEEPSFILCSVVDQGIGIPKAEKEKIFGRFFRAQNALRVETDGSGLGLFIVRGIIQRHGGDVSFESEEGKGTTMKFRLPLDPLARTQLSP